MKQAYDFDTPVDRSSTYSIKYDCMPGNAPADALALWIADMDFPSAQPIVDALHARVDRLIYGYTSYDNADVKNAVRGWFSRRFGWEIAPDSIFYATCVVTAFSMLIDLLSEPGDGIVIQPPVYHPFALKIRANGRRVIENPLLCTDGEYTMDFADLEQKLSQPDVKGLLLCSPHNPGGRVWTPDELCRVVEIAKRYDKWIISDEIHCDILRAGVTHHPLLKLCPDYANRIITCTSPGKSFNLAGLQLSNIIIPSPEYRALWTSLAHERLALTDGNLFGITALIAAYNEGEEWLNAVNAYIDENIAFARRFLAERLPRARMPKLEGTYLLWVDFNAYFPDASELERVLTNECRVVVNTGRMFGTQGIGFARINAGCPRSVLAKALERIAAVLEKR